MERHPHLFVRVPGQPTLCVERLDDVDISASTSDGSLADVSTPDSPASEIDVKRRVSSASGDATSPLDSDHGSSTFYVGSNDSACSLPDKQVSIETDSPIDNPFNFDHWPDLEDLVLPHAFMPDTIYGQGHQGLLQHPDYMLPFSSCTPDHMAPAYILQTTQPRFGAECYGFDGPAPLAHPTFMDPYSAPMMADYGYCGQPVHSQAQAQRQANMPFMMSPPGNNLIASQEWAMGQQGMAFVHGQMLPSNAGPMPAPHTAYSYGGPHMPVNVSHIPRSFDNRSHRHRIVSR